MTTPRSLDDELVGRLHHQRVVLLDSELDEASGNRLRNQLMLLSADDAHRDIAFWINSPGGSVPAMLALHDVMRLIPNDVVTVAIGLACSAGQFLLSAGTPGKRYALPHSKVLLHQGSAGIGGAAVDVELQADDLRQTRDTVLGLIAEHTGQPLERVFADSLRDRWYTAQAALAYGFVDAIVSDVAQVLPDARRTSGFGLPTGLIGASS